MTVDTVRWGSPSVFDAGLPTIAYEDGQNPDDAHRLIRQARQQAPIALGPHGPQLLTYDLCAPCCAIPGFACRTGSVSRHKASPQVPCGTGSLRAC